jgi:hypothetical protein
MTEFAGDPGFPECHWKSCFWPIWALQQTRAWIFQKRLSVKGGILVDSNLYSEQVLSCLASQGRKGRIDWPGIQDCLKAVVLATLGLSTTTNPCVNFQKCSSAKYVTYNRPWSSSEQIFTFPCKRTEDAMVEMSGNLAFPEKRVSRHLGHSHANTHVRESLRSAQKPNRFFC